MKEDILCDLGLVIIIIIIIIIITRGKVRNLYIILVGKHE